MTAITGKQRYVVSHTTRNCISKISYPVRFLVYINPTNEQLIASVFPQVRELQSAGLLEGSVGYLYDTNCVD